MAVAAFIQVADDDASHDAELAGFTEARDRDLRGRDRLFLVESPRVVRRFLRSAWRCASMLVTPERWDELRDLAEARPEPIRVLAVSERRMSATSGYRLHGGALALGERTYWPPPTDSLLARLPADGDLTLLVAQGVVQVDNVGAIFRSAACFGAAGVLLDGDCADPLLRKCIRFSMGRVFDIPWAVSRDLATDLDRLRGIGIRSVAVELTAEARPLRELEPDGRVALIVGSESRGVRAEILDRCAATFAIPNAGRDEDGEERSLNVAVAAAIALHHRRR